MTQAALLMGSGLSASAARHIVGTAASGLTATGSSQSDALPLVDVNEFTTVGASTGGILPPNCNRGDSILVYVATGQSTLTVYPPVGETINALTAGQGVSVAANKAAKFFKVSTSRWASVLTA